MGKLKHTFLAFTGMALTSCAAPRAVVVEQTPVAKKQTVPEPTAQEPVELALPDDGLRLPEMLDLPSDGDFRATNPPPSKVGNEAGAVISRPPTDPPSRVKPTPPAAE